MVLFEIDPDGITALPFKRDPPRTVHCKSVTHWPRVQRMEPPPRHAQIIKRFCAMKRLQPATHAFHEVRTNTARVVREEKVA